MPSHDSCCVPGCTNQKNFCKWGLFTSEDGEIVRKRLCGAEGKGGFKNTSTVCKELSFFSARRTFFSTHSQVLHQKHQMCERIFSTLPLFVHQKHSMCEKFF